MQESIMNNSPAPGHQNVGYEMASESLGRRNPVTAVPSITLSTG